MEFEDDGFASYGGLAYDSVPYDEADALIVGIPYEAASSGKKGSSLAPVYMRLHSADLQIISRWGVNLDLMTVRDVGNIPVYPLHADKNRESIQTYYSHLLTAGTPIIAFGGDHSITYSLLSSLSKTAKVGVVWFDAHRDVLPELLHDRYSHGSSLRRAIELPNIAPENVLLVGTRYMEPTEQQFIDENPINELRMIDIERVADPLREFKHQVQLLAERVDHVYLSIDIDVLDPAYAPGTGTPVAGGMSTSQLLQFIHAIPINVRAFDIMEVAPPLDPSGITVKGALTLLTELLAKIYAKKTSI